MRISQATFDALTRETFVNNFFSQLAEQGEDLGTERSDPEIRRQVWALAQEATRVGIASVGGALIFVRIHWDLGLDCITRMEGLRSILDNTAFSEETKVARMWQVRCAIFDALNTD